MHPFLDASSARGTDDATGLAITVTGISDEDLTVNDGMWDVRNNLEDGATGMVCDIVETTARVVHKSLPSATRNIYAMANKFRVLRVGSDKSSYNVSDL